MPFMVKSFAAIAAGSLAIMPAYASEAPLVPPVKDKPICKTETTIGTMIPGPRRCHTRAQWEDHARAGQAIARTLVEEGTSRPNGN